MVVTNAGTTMQRASVKVLEDYEAIEEPPQNITTSLGTTVSFHCKTPLAVRRYMQWVRLHEDRIEELVDQTEVLTIYNVTEEDAGH